MTVLNFKAAATDSPTSTAVPHRSHHLHAVRRLTRTVASVGLRFLVTALRWIAEPFAFVCGFTRAFYGVEDGDIQIVVPCAICSDPISGYKDGHPEGEPCPRLLIADCAECLRPVDLNRFGWCALNGTHHVTNRRPKPKPKRFAVLSAANMADG